jgi:carbon-monoxide dehydrogenase medium subunit
VKPAAFAYHRPDSVEEALRQLAACGSSAKVLAGGQSLGPMMNMRLASPSDLIDLNDLTELAYVRTAGDMLEIGALTPHVKIATSPLVLERCPLLAAASSTSGHYAIRQRGTLGGSLAHADPAAQLPLIAVTLGAQIELVSSRATRIVAAVDFFQSVMATALAPDEIIRCVRFPVKQPHEGASYQIFNRRHGDYAIVAAAASVVLDGDRVASLRVGLSGVAAVPLSFPDIVRQFVGAAAHGTQSVPDRTELVSVEVAPGTQPVPVRTELVEVPQANLGDKIADASDATWAAAVARAVSDFVSPEDDERISAVYRKELALTLVERALLRAVQRAKE